MASSSNDFAEIDSKTQAVFTKKGYQLQAKLGQGAFGQVLSIAFYLAFSNKNLLLSGIQGHQRQKGQSSVRC